MMGESLGRQPPGSAKRGRRGALGPASVPAVSSGSYVLPVLEYEKQLNRDPRWALSEGSRHFEEKSSVFEALHKIARRLKDLGIPYAVIGGMALFRHGLRRFT